MEVVILEIQKVQLAGDFIDVNLEKSFLASIADDPQAYWQVYDMLPQGVFTAHQDLWDKIQQNIQNDETVDPVDANPATDPVQAAEDLGDLYKKRVLASTYQDHLRRLRLGATADTLLTDYHEELLAVRQTIKLVEGDLRWSSDLIPGVLANAEARLVKREETGVSVMGLQTGISQLDTVLNGLDQGLYILAGPPNLGKTTLCLQWAYNIAKEGTPVVYVTYENSPSDLTLKLLCRLMSLPISDVTRGCADMVSLRRAGSMLEPTGKRIAFVEGSSKLTIPEVKGKARMAMYRHKTEKCLVVIDFLQKMATGKASDSRQSVSVLVSELTELARTLESPVLAISALSRAGYKDEGQKAHLDTLKESGDLEYGADVVLFLQKGTAPCTPPAQSVFLRIAKNRHGESGKSIDLVFRADVAIFAPPEKGTA